MKNLLHLIETLARATYRVTGELLQIIAWIAVLLVIGITIAGMIMFGFEIHSAFSNTFIQIVAVFLVLIGFVLIIIWVIAILKALGFFTPIKNQAEIDGEDTGTKTTTQTISKKLARGFWHARFSGMFILILFFIEISSVSLWKYFEPSHQFGWSIFRYIAVFSKNLLVMIK